MEAGINLNLARRHLTREQKCKLEEELRAKGWTQQKVADALGISKSTVSIHESIKKAENGNESPDGSFSFEKLDSYSADDLMVSKAAGFSYSAKDKTLIISHADAIVVNKSKFLTNVDNFQIKTNEFEVKSADSVRFQCNQVIAGNDSEMGKWVANGLD